MSKAPKEITEGRRKNLKKKKFMKSRLTPMISQMFRAVLEDESRSELIMFFTRNKDCFALLHLDMGGVNSKVIIYQLNVDPLFRPVRKKRRKLAVDRNNVVNEEVKRLLESRIIHKVQYPKWLVNLVVVPNKNKKMRVCIYFTYLNKACPKDCFPLPHID